VLAAGSGAERRPIDWIAAVAARRFVDMAATTKARRKPVSSTSPIRRGSADDAPTLWTAEEVAERLGVKLRWVHRAMELRRLPFVKVGRLVRFKPEAIEAWIEANSHDGGDAA
jgi:excisionase family DNA binding protein